MLVAGDDSGLRDEMMNREMTKKMQYKQGQSDIANDWSAATGQNAASAGGGEASPYPDPEKDMAGYTARREQDLAQRAPDPSGEPQMIVDSREDMGMGSELGRGREMEMRDKFRGDRGRRDTLAGLVGGMSGMSGAGMEQGGSALPPDLQRQLEWNRAQQRGPGMGMPMTKPMPMPDGELGTGGAMPKPMRLPPSGGFGQAIGAMGGALGGAALGGGRMRPSAPQDPFGGMPLSRPDDGSQQAYLQQLLQQGRRAGPVPRPTQGLPEGPDAIGGAMGLGGGGDAFKQALMQRYGFKRR